ncbi:hypothetical protein MDAP_001003 [Mitosporidium daphniae]|uniref:D-glutamate cyclase-like C-terminal domain-containing protein n=1 Tax=Mitosporidium daphniae TaxID=1485682 RepID=A0A098VPU4_9MICR|nr:uncharacterized protein DI09_45p40 [Mitosporidium daphniae]KGG51077.1 hypothetical protein DI09_45p40 [Mitosporidium daphniae]|eukprot:XP_013237522.1 uncharacterized protein DI09_45p40 [Mitosporidium daphniae]
MINSGELEQAIHRDIGKRGLETLFPIVCGSLQRSASLIQRCNSIAILTGFNIPPQETDGPPGAIALARALSFLGKRAIFVADDYCHDVLAAGIKASDQCYLNSASFPIEVFHKEVNDPEKARMKSEALCRKYNVDCMISIEHVGPSYSDGRLYRMNGLDTTANEGYSYVFFETLDKINIPKVAIADGGNELGCAKILDSLLDSSICKIPNIDKIACRTSCDELILAGVSNWGGYALSLLISQTKEILCVDAERSILKAIVDAGAVDPRNGSAMFVDGLAFDPIHADVIAALLK